MNDTTETLLPELRDYDYAEGYAEELLNARIATQIKVLREQQKMKQAELAAAMGTTQTAISRIENVNYSSWSIKTLKKIARALKLRLNVSFESFGTLPDDVEGFTRERMERPAHDKDPRIWPERFQPIEGTVRAEELVFDSTEQLENVQSSVNGRRTRLDINDSVGASVARKGPTHEDGTAHLNIQGTQWQTN